MDASARKGPREAPACTPASPAPRVAPWDMGGCRSDDGWNRGFAHPDATSHPEDPRGINWGSFCPACRASFRTTCGTEGDAILVLGQPQ